VLDEKKPSLGVADTRALFPIESRIDPSDESCDEFSNLDRRVLSRKYSRMIG